MIKITPAAAQEIERLKANLPDSKSVVHLSLKPGGCCELVYVLEFKTLELDAPAPEEQIVVAPQGAEHLANLTIDYSEDLMGGGFRFQNPQAQTSCSCSQSFTPRRN